MKKTRRFKLRSIILTAALSVVFTLGAVALALWLLLDREKFIDINWQFSLPETSA